MNKTDLVEVVALKTELSKKDSEKAVKAVFEAIEEALDNINVEELVHSRRSSKVEDIDIESMLESIIRDYIDEELEELDIDSEVLSALQDNFD